MGLFDSLVKKAQDAVNAKAKEFTNKVDSLKQKTTTPSLDVLKKKKVSSVKSSNLYSGAFVPNPKKTEYENCLDFIAAGGTSEEWELITASNKFSFKLDKTEIFMQYEKEVKDISKKYFSLMEKIQQNWSILYNLNEWSGTFASTFEKDCLDDITYYKAMREIDKKYGEKSPTNIPAYKRLAMLYEKQSKFEEAIAVCKEAYIYGMDERSRMLRIIKKVGRPLTEKETALFNK